MPYDIDTMPVCNSPGEVYDFLKSLYTADIERRIKIDLYRTCAGNEDFKKPHLEGQNPLYNVVNAYAHYDLEIGYCQGICFIAALLLHYIKDEQDARKTVNQMFDEQNGVQSQYD